MSLIRDNNILIHKKISSVLDNLNKKTYIAKEGILNKVGCF